MAIDYAGGMTGISALIDAPPGLETTGRRLDALWRDLEVARDKGVFVPLPTSRPETSADVSRIKTIRTRLANLGYLDAPANTARLDDPLKTAISRFQREAGLTVDRWVGEQTWTALAQLVGFEAPIDVLRWFNGGRPGPALRRAIHLRLFAFGLMKDKPETPEGDIAAGITAFARCWRQLDLGPAPEPAGLTLAWIARLFDMDDLTARLGRTRTPENRSVKIDIHGLVINAAKIELWLAGYDVAPTGYDLVAQRRDPGGDDDLGKMTLWMRSSTLSQYLRLKKNMRFYKALHRFWKDQGLTDKTALEKRTVHFVDSFPLFFASIDEGLKAAAGVDAAQRREQLETVLSRHPGQIETIWQTVRRLGSRIWDGVRRVWGWLKNLIHRAAGKIVTLGRNLSRLIYEHTLAAFTVVVNVFNAFGEAIRLITDKIVAGSDPASLVAWHDRDLDFNLAVHDRAGPGAVTARIGHLDRISRHFGFACRLLGTLMALVNTLIKSGSSGYIGLILALVRLKDHRRRLESLADAYQACFASD